jgi:RNA polymerase sigma-70 factor, ECF subfamily
MSNLAPMDSNPQHHCRTGPPGPRSGVPTPRAIDQGLQRQIEAVIPRLRRYARALVRDSVTADDLVQDCLTRALSKIHLWQEGTDLCAWLFTILHNQHITLARRTARERDHLELKRDYLELARSPNQTARLELRDLDRAIAKLPDEQRAILLIIGLEGMGYDEVATVLNLPVGTVRSRLSRGRKTLRILTGLFPNRHCRSPGLATKARCRLARNIDRKSLPPKVSTDRSVDIFLPVDVPIATAN